MKEEEYLGLDLQPLACVGYDSDVARERTTDYPTKVYAVSIREMSGTKPHLQQKEVLVDER